MAILNLDIGSDDQKIDSRNYSRGDVVNITALGSRKLIVDGVDVTLSSIRGAYPGAHPTFAVINGGTLTVDHGLLDARVLSGCTYSVSDISSVAVVTDGVGVQSHLLQEVCVDFNGSGDADFSYEPPALRLLPPLVFHVVGMESLDQLVIAGRTDLRFAYNPTRRRGRVSSTAPGRQDVSYVICGITPAQAERITADFNCSITQARSGAETFTVPLCLTSDSHVLTPRGRKRCEDLRIGDLVVTSDRGAQPIRWIGRMTFEAAELAEQPRNRPIRIAANALGKGVPVAELKVSPQYRLLVHSSVAERMIGSAEVLIPAKKLLHLPGVEVVEIDEDVTYMHLMFDHHEVIFAENAPVESRLTGPMAMKGVAPGMREEIARILPAILEEDFQVTDIRPIPSRARRPGTAAPHPYMQAQES